MLKKFPLCRDEVCAVITTYQPDSQFPDRVERIRCQVGKVVIVDDRGNESNVAFLSKCFGGLYDVTIHRNPENKGIAFSLNMGVAIAKMFGYTWVVTLDDDTTVDLRMVERLSFYLRKIDGNSPVGLIGMSWTQFEASEQLPKLVKKRPWRDVCYIITSGTLFSLSTYDNIGPFRNEFVIGFVDYDYCLRARSKGYRVVKVAETGFEHVLGNPTVSRLFGKKIFVRNCNAERHYYLQRNATILLCEYFWLDFKCGLIAVLHQIRTLIKIMLLEEQKLNKMRSMWRGMIDGLHNRIDKMKAKGKMN